MSEPRVRVAVDGAMATILLDRPDKLNALDLQGIGDLAAACDRVDRDESVRVVILTGAGNAFCAGGDIEAWGGLSPTEFARRWLRDGHAAFDAVARLRQPVIAVLNGHALGGGLELAACADLRIAEAHVKIGQPETGLGVVTGWSGTQRATRRFGSQTVRRMALFGEIWTAEEALAHGVVDHVTPKGEGMALALEIAERTAAKGHIATEITKMTINAAEGEEVERPLDVLAGGFAASTEDLAEGVAAYLDKRKPSFKGS